MNTQFWMYIDNRWQGISLALNEKVRFSSHHKTDEGFSSESIVIIRDDLGLTMERETNGRDCDGRLSTSETFSSDVMEVFLDTDTNTQYKRPIWRKIDSSVFDEYAQSANY